MDSVELLTAKIQSLPPEQQTKVLDFVEFLLSKYPSDKSSESAEELALERSKDIDNPTKWTTIIEAGDSVDVESSLKNLSERGYKIKISG